MKGRLKTKLISSLLIIFILTNTFSPYSVLLNKSYAADVTSGIPIDTLSVKPAVVFKRTTGIETAGNGQRYFGVELGVLGDSTATDGAWVVNKGQVYFRYATDKIAPLSKSNEVLDSNQEVYKNGGRDKFKISNYVSEISGGLTLEFGLEQGAGTRLNYSGNTEEGPGAVSFELSNNDAVDPVYWVESNPDSTFNGKPYIPVATMNFAIIDDSITDVSQLTFDLNANNGILSLNRIGAVESGILIVYYDDYDTASLGDTKKSKVITSEYLTLDGFKLAEESNEIASVALKQSPRKKAYEHGDTVELDEGIIEITYENGSTEEVPLIDNEGNENPDFVLDNRKVVVGQTKVAGTYLGKYNLEYDITVTDPIAKVERIGDLKTREYYQGNTIELEGISVVVKTKSQVENNEPGRTIALPSTEVAVSETLADVNSVNATKSEITTPEGFAIATQTIFLTPEGTPEGVRPASVDILVNDTIKEITNISGYKTTYEYGQDFDKEQGNITVKTTSGATFVVKLNKTVIVQADNEDEGYSSTTLNKQILQAVYLGKKSPEFQVTVTDPIVGIGVRGFKTTYNPKEELDFTGAKVYEIGKSTTTYSETDLTKEMVTNYISTKVGKQTLTVSYKGKSTTLTVNVLDVVSEIEVTEMKTTYNYGDSLDLTGAKVTPILYSGAKRDSVKVTQEMIISTFNPYQVGEQTVTVQYEGKTADVKVMVNDTVKEIAVKTPPKTIYKYGEGLSVENGEITVKWNSGANDTTEAITESMITEEYGEKFDTTLRFPAGQLTHTKPITITYGGQSTEYDITVANEIDKIEVTKKPKTYYNINEKLDVTGGEITITRLNGDTETKALTKPDGTIADGIAVTGFDSSAEVKVQPLEVTYTETLPTKTVSKKATYNVQIEDQIISIKVTAQPTQYEYGYGESLKLKGAKLAVTKGSDTYPIDVTEEMITNYEPRQIGAQNLIVAYGGKTSSVTIDIKVVDKVESIEMNKTKMPPQEYAIGGTLNTIGGEIIIHRQSGATQTKGLGEGGITITGLNTTAEVEDQSLEVTYAETYEQSNASAVAHYTIDVIDRLDSIALVDDSSVTDQSKKLKKRYKDGEPLSKVNGIVELTLKSGAKERIDLEKCEVRDYQERPKYADNSIETIQTLTIAYRKAGDEKKATYKVKSVNEIKEIEVTTPPTKVYYNVGDTLDVTDGKITVTRLNGATEEKDIQEAWVSGFNSSTGATQQVLTVTYAETYQDEDKTNRDETRTATYSIDVVDQIKSISINTQPNKKEYGYQEELDLTGATILVTYGSGTNPTPVPITRDMVSGYDPEVIGPQDLTVTYNGVTDTVSKLKVEVINKLVKIEIYDGDKPTQVYPIGGTFDNKGSIRIIRQKQVEGEDPETKQLTAEGVTVTAPVTTVEQKGQKLTVTYTETYKESSITQTKDYTIDVIDQLVSISLQDHSSEDPNLKLKKRYRHGEGLSKDNGIVIATLASGATKEIDLSECQVDRYVKEPTYVPNSIETTQTLIVSYEKDGVTKTTTYDVTSVNEMTGIRVAEGTGLKTLYNINDKLDVTDGKIIISRLNRTTEEKPIDPSWVITPLDTTRESTNQRLTIQYVENGADIVDGKIQPITETAEYFVNVKDTVKSIKVISQPTRTKFAHDEAIDLQGAQIEVTKGSGTTTESVLASMVNYDRTTLGPQQLTVTYGGQTANETIDVEVINKVVSIELDRANMPTQVYPLNGTFDKKGRIKINRQVQGENPEYKFLTAEGITVTTPVTSKEEKGQQLTITYKELYETYGENEEFSATAHVNYTIDVIDELVSIALVDDSNEQDSALRLKRVYKHGEELSTKNGLVKLTLASGAQETVFLRDCEVNDYIAEPEYEGNPTEKIQTLEIAYTRNGVRKTTTYNVISVNEMTEISIKTNPKQQYNINDELNVDGGEITITRRNNTKEDKKIDPSWVSTLDTTTEGIKQLIITYPETYPETYTGTEVTTTRTKEEKIRYSVTVKDTVTSIEVVGTLNKTIYGYKEELNLDGVMLKVTYGSGTKPPIPITRDMVPSYNPEKIGPQSLAVTYGGQTADEELNVEVVNKVTGIRLDTILKDTYAKDEEIDKNQEIIIERQNGTTDKKKISESGVTVEGFDSSKEVKHQRITVKYNETYSEEKETYYYIDVIDQLLSISLYENSDETDPTKIIKKEYKYDEKFDENGIVILNLASGTTVEKKLSECTIDGYNATPPFGPDDVSTQKITVKYTKDNVEKEAYYDVTVKNYVKAIEVKAPKKVNYGYNDSITPEDLAEGTVTKIMANDVRKAPIELTNPTVTVVTKDPTTGYNVTKNIGEVSVKVICEEKEGSFTIMVQDEVTSVEMHGDVIQKYRIGEKFNSNGAYIVVRSKSNPEPGSTKQITADMITGFNTETITAVDGGTRTLTITAKGIKVPSATNTDELVDWTKQYTYQVEDYVKDIKLTPPEKTRYTYYKSPTNSDNSLEKATLDITGGKIVKVMASGEETTEIGLDGLGVQYGLVIDDKNSDNNVEYYSNRLGEQVIKVKCEGKEKEFSIFVRDELQSITLTKDPITTYTYGDNFKANGAQIKISRLTGDEYIELTEEYITNFYTKAGTGITASQALTNGTARTATVSYTWRDPGDTEDKNQTKTRAFLYTVNDQVEDIILTEPKNKEYYYGKTEKIDLTEGTVQKVMKSGVTQEVVDLEDIRDDITGYNYTKLGEQDITVNYGGKTKTFKVNVKDRLEDISVSNLPTQTYYIGDNINLEGALISIDRLAVDENNLSLKKAVEEGKAVINNFSTTQETEEEKATITVTEDGITKIHEFTYTVKDFVSDVNLVETDESKYYLKDTQSKFDTDLANRHLRITMASGKPASDIPLSDAKVSTTGFDTSTVGTKIITVIYKNEKNQNISAGRFNINVYDLLEKVELIGTPRTEYLYGEELDLNGATLTVTKRSGVQENVQIDTVNGISGFDTTVLGENKTATITYVDYSENRNFLEIPEGKNKIPFTYTVKDYVSGITKIQPPTKTDYDLNSEEPLSLEGGYIEVKNASNNEVERIKLSETDKVTVTGFDNTTTKSVGEKTITITYTNEKDEELTKTFTITVWDKLTGDVSIEGTPKAEYKFGDEDIVLNGAKLVVNRLSGTEKITITEAMLNGTITTNTLTEEGQPRQAVVTYTKNAQTDAYLKIPENIATQVSFPYTVKDYISSVTLKAPSKVKYDYGTDLDLSDGYLILTMASGNSAENVPLEDNDEVQITGYDKNKLGAQTVNIEYKGFTEGLSFGVVVENKVKEVQFNVDSINAKDYKYGENLDLSKATAKVIMLDGTETTVEIDNTMIDGYTSTKLGEQEITITVEGKQKKITVNVVDYVTNVELTPPEKNVYIVKEPLDLEKGKLKVTMASGQIKDNIPLTDSKVKVTGYKPTELGSQIVKVVYDNYDKLAKEFPVQVVDKLAGISIESLPDKTQIKYGEELEIEGAKIRITNESGESKVLDVTPEMIKTKFDPEKLGPQTIKVEYTEDGVTKSTEFAVVVEDYVKEIKFTKPSKTSYKYGEELDPTGGKFTEILASGAIKQEIAVTKDMVKGFNNKEVGKQTLTVSYGDQKEKFDVSVADNIISVAITKLPDKTEYNKGESLNLVGGTITVIKDSGIYNLDITEDMVTGYDANKPGSQVLTIKYSEQQAFLSIIVKDDENGGNNQEPEKPSKPSKPSKPNKPSNGSNSETPDSNGRVVDDVTPGTDNNIPDDKTNANASENKDKEHNNDVDKDITLAEKSENSDDDKEKKDNIIVRTATVSGLGLVALIALVFIIKRRENVRIYEEDENELILVGKEKLDPDYKEIDITKYIENAPDKNIVVVLNKNIAKELDKQKISIRIDKEELETIVEYENGEFEIRIEK